MPIVASDLHQTYLQSVADTALSESGSGLSYRDDIDVLAVTVGPGMALCLKVGLGFVKGLAIEFG